MVDGDGFCEYCGSIEILGREYTVWRLTGRVLSLDDGREVASCVDHDAAQVLVSGRVSDLALSSVLRDAQAATTLSASEPVEPDP